VDHSGSPGTHLPHALLNIYAYPIRKIKTKKIFFYM